MNDVQTVKDAFTKKDKKVGRIQSEKRVIAFRDEEHAIDNKSHLAFIEAKVDFNTDSFIKAIEDAIQKQVELYNKPVSEREKNVIPETKEISKPSEDPINDILGIETSKEEETEKNMVVDEAKNADLKEKITKTLTELGAKKDRSKAPGVKKILEGYGLTKIENNSPTAALEEILKYIQ